MTTLQDVNDSLAGRIESNVPITDEYWKVVNRYRFDQLKLKTGRNSLSEFLGRLFEPDHPIVEPEPPTVPDFKPPDLKPPIIDTKPPIIDTKPPIIDINPPQFPDTKPPQFPDTKPPIDVKPPDIKPPDIIDPPIKPSIDINDLLGRK